MQHQQWLAMRYALSHLPFNFSTDSKDTAP